MKRRLDDPGKGMRSRGLLAFGVGSLVWLALTSCSETIPEETVVRPVKTVIFGGEATRSVARSFPGRVQAAQQARLSFRVAGPLIELPVFEGQQVAEGQVLARIDPRDYQTAVSNLQARVADLKAQYEAMKQARPEDIRALEAALTGAQARLLEAEATLRRYRRLYENDNVAKAEYDQRRAARDVAAADVRTAEESLAVGREGARPEDLQAMEARIQAMNAELRRATDQLADTTLRAPYDGIVAEVFVENFEFIQAQQQVLSLQDVTIVEVVAQVPEALVARSRQQEAPLELVARFESLPGREFPARLTEVAGQSDPVTRTFEVTCSFDAPSDVNILPGMTAKLIVSGVGAKSTGGAIRLPSQAVVAADDGSSFVWVVDPGSMKGGRPFRR